MTCGVGHRCSLDLGLLQLWCRPVAAALIGPLAWEPPYAVGAGPKKQERKKERVKKQSVLVKVRSRWNLYRFMVGCELEQPSLKSL